MISTPLWERVVLALFVVNTIGCALALLYLHALRRTRLWRSRQTVGDYVLLWPWMLLQLVLGQIERWERRRAKARQARWKARMEERWKNRDQT